ncbi:MULTISPECIES: DUF3846 domain-containing protein [Clostridium]|uniref:DUF3846 domain-containing protein n=1 Tax=Clostridium TaxID=1485 RepID=UPI0008267F8A|nr:MULTISPECIES: hypothetical protein [Clostridium]PJI10244.1 hypothetical protein CUB90_21240 [Clostridium sp. CT7]
MKLVKTLNNISINDLGFEEWYSFNENVYFKFYDNSLRIFSLENAMKKGKKVTRYSVYSKIYNNGFKAAFLNYLNDLQLNIVEFISKLQEDEIKETSELGIRMTLEKGVRVFNPFYIPKKIKEPAKWRISQVIKAVMSGQIIKGKCTMHLTDDYAYDNSTNFGKREINVLELCKELVENPNGWWIKKEKEVKEFKIVGVHCYNFNYNEVYFKETAAKRIIKFDDNNADKVMKEIKCLLCKGEKVKEVTIEANLKTYYKLINCSTIAFMNVPITEDMNSSIEAIVDDEGRITGKEISKILYPYLKKKYGYGIAGDFLIVKVNNRTGDTISMTDGDIKMVTTFIKVQEYNYGKSPNEYDTQREIEKKEL